MTLDRQQTPAPTPTCYGCEMGWKVLGRIHYRGRAKFYVCTSEQPAPPTPAAGETAPKWWALYRWVISDPRPLPADVSADIDRLYAMAQDAHFAAARGAGAEPPTDEQVDAALQAHPIFGPAIRGEVTSISIAPAHGIPPEASR